MTLVRVNPESVREYGTQAQGIFESMHASLDRLVTDVVAVRYYGPNAVAFKTECGRIAAEFASKLHLDMAAMADAVRTSTSNIAASLGGSPIVIRVDGRAVTPPAPEVVDYVDVDTDALEAAVPVVVARFGELRESLDSHLSRLSATDWQGNAKVQAVAAVTSFTGAAKGKCTSTELELTNYMRRQVQAVVAADR